MWPESGHQPTTRPGPAPPAGAQRLHQRHQRQLGAHRVAPRARTARPGAPPGCARRPGRAAPSSAECGLSHQWSRPTTGGAPRAAQSSAHHSRVAHVTASAATALRPAAGSAATQRSSWETDAAAVADRRGRLSSSRARTASSGRAGLAGRQGPHRGQPDRPPRRARRPREGLVVGRPAATVAERATRTSWSVTRNGPAPARRTASPASVRRASSSAARHAPVSRGPGRRARPPAPPSALQSRWRPAPPAPVRPGPEPAAASHAARCEAMARRCSSRTSSMP